MLISLLTKRENVKAHWNDQHTKVFLDLCLQLRDQGYASNGRLQKRGFQAMEPLFLQQTGWKHEWDQLRNRWNQLQHMYSWYKKHSKSTGVTLGPDGQINADPGWWVDNTKVISHMFQLLNFT
jgi:hypothetical protein